MEKDEPDSIDIYDFPDYFLIHSRNEIRDKHKAIHWLQNAKLLLNDSDHYTRGFYSFNLLIIYQMESIIEFGNCEYLSNMIRSYQIVRIVGIEKYANRLRVKIANLKRKIESEYDNLIVSFLESELSSYEKRAVEDKYIEGNYVKDPRYIVAYAHYKGIRIEKDLEEAKEHMHLMPADTWKLF